MSSRGPFNHSVPAPAALNTWSGWQHLDPVATVCYSRRRGCNLVLSRSLHRGTATNSAQSSLGNAQHHPNTHNLLTAHSPGNNSHQVPDCTTETTCCKAPLALPNNKKK